MVLFVVKETYDVRCTYENMASIFGGFRYTCFIVNQGNLVFQRLLGKHLNGYCNADVDIVCINDCYLKRIPKCLIDYFPNMRVLDINRCDLSQICKADLIPFRTLHKFGSFDNRIAHLPGDLFEGFANLECIEFVNNKVEVIIEPNILDGLTKLKHVNFKGNPNFNKCFSTYPKNKSNATLKQIKDEFYEKFFAKFKYVKALKDSNDKLSKETEQLRKSIEVKNQGSLLNDIKKLLNNENTKDLTIKVDNRDFRVHKFVLASRSPFFAQMFKERPDVDILILEDLPYFGLIVTYCYTDALPIVPNFVNLLSVAGKLQMIKLRDHAASMVVNHMNDGNSVEIFGLCCKYGYDKPMKEAYARIKKTYGKYINFKDEWLTKPNELVSIIEGFKKQDDELKKFVNKFDNLTVKK